MASALEAGRANIRPQFDYVDAKGVEEAVAFIQQHRGSVTVIAGGQDMLWSLKVGASNTRYAPEVLLNIKKIPELNKVEALADGALRLGALVTHRQLQASDVVRDRYPVLAEAAERVATPQIQNVATIGGNLCQDMWCWYYRAEEWRFNCFRKGGDVCFVASGDDRYEAVLDPGPCHCAHGSDLAPVLIALDATATIAGPDGLRTIPLQEFFVHSRDDPRVTTVIDPLYEKTPEVLLTYVTIPDKASATQVAYIKQTMRSSFDHNKTGAGVAVALAMRESFVTQARIVLGGVSNVPYRVEEAEKVLEGKKISDTVLDRVADKAMELANPMRENRYKLVVAREVLKRAIRKAAGIT